MRIFLAPMEGVVDHHMRHTLHAVKGKAQQSGIDLCVTEFVRVTEHTLPRKVFLRACPELSETGTYPVRVQLLGSNPETLASNAFKAAQLGAPAIDLNFGCPAKTVNKSRGGACLLNETGLLGEIVSAVREAVPEEIPVTAKIRLGYENREPYLKNALAIAAAGADELVVHARSKVDGYKPPAYWEYIADIRQALSIPVVANGEIWTLDDFIRCREVTGCEDFMLGRGLLAQPDLALQIKAYTAGETYLPLTWVDIAPLVHAFFLQTCDAYPRKYMGNRLKQWLHYLQRTYTEAQALFADIKQLRDRDPIDARLRRELHAP